MNTQQKHQVEEQSQEQNPELALLEALDAKLREEELATLQFKNQRDEEEARAKAAVIVFLPLAFFTGFYVLYCLANSSQVYNYYHLF